ncbi:MULTISPECIES: hypothetical protein [unclassified Guyparkeria]|uniref:hypothetical protein n=1 Tax=unclassified Guyparkeria TaxID=2626246 RepID=UPI0007333C15|nr:MULTISPECIES: hypothetical protein [unclassified Guyparkeria]KTG15994.1 hypothetical protein AUR63_05970 [Guyparkeria sp. XI15]OAE84749.1 hypothetical protein AWR35_05980 [Guyparkeria sp. WRN-7]
MRAADIITTLVGRGIAVSLEDGRIHARPGHRLTDDDVRLIRQHKPALIYLLTTRAEADEAGTLAAGESPRALSPIEKAGIARLCRQQYGADDEAIRATIENCEVCPSMREYHLALDRLRRPTGVSISEEGRNH